jgi:Na+-translocating ferredoxin:NAD+ oxidoreductase RnfD subunit
VILILENPRIEALRDPPTSRLLGATKSDASTETSASTPWHLWLIAILTLLWNAMGSYDFVMTQTRNTEYLEQVLSEEQQQFFFDFPIWAVLLWGVSVGGAALGSLLLLARRALAVRVYAVALVTYVLCMVFQYCIAGVLDVLTDTFSHIVSGVIFFIALGEFLYARSMARKSVLR